MTAVDKEIVPALGDALRQRLGPQRYELWFERSAQLQCVADALCVLCRSPFVADLLKRQFHHELLAVCRSNLGHQTVRYEVQGEGRMKESAVTGKASQTGREIAAASERQSAAERADAPPLRVHREASRQEPRQAAEQADDMSQAPGPLARRQPESFESFVVGGGNRLAFTAAELVAQRPGHTTPLVLHGPTATGKTHLLEAVRHQLRQRHGRQVVLYLTAEQFTSAFIDSLYRKELPSLRQKYRSADVLLLDDIHFLIGKSKTTGELLTVIDMLHRANCQLIFTANRPPAELAELGPELTSRLGGGMTAEIQPPDFATRLALVRQLSRRMELPFTGSVLQLIAAQIGLDARGIRGALHRLYAESLAAGRPPSRALAEETLGQIAQESQRPVRLADVERAVCDVFGVEPKSLKSSRKAASVSGARMLAMFLARKYTRAALVEIGHHFGRRSHSTVIAASKRVEQWMNCGRRLTLADRQCGVEEAIRRVEEALRRA